jgi:hypothetical protein
MSALAGSTELVCGTCGQRAPRGYEGPRDFDEAKARHRREGDRILRSGAVTPFVVGIVFLALALGCLIATAIEAVGEVSGGITDLASLPAGLVGWPLFGLFWAGLGGAAVFAGRRGLRQLALRKRLRTSGVPGFGTVLEWDESESSGFTTYKMKLNIELPGQHPYRVRVREITFTHSVYTNLKLRVLVDPANGQNVVVDWDGP